MEGEVAIRAMRNGTRVLLSTDANSADIVIARDCVDPEAIASVIQRGIENLFSKLFESTSRCPECRRRLFGRSTIRAGETVFIDSAGRMTSLDHLSLPLTKNPYRGFTFVELAYRQRERQEAARRRAREVNSAYGQSLTGQVEAEIRLGAMNPGDLVHVVDPVSKEVHSFGAPVNSWTNPVLDNSLEKPTEPITLTTCCNACGGELVEAMLFTSSELRCKDCGHVHGS